MPSIIIWGMPTELANTNELKKLLQEYIPEAVASISSLDLKNDQVHVFAPPNLLSADLGVELIVHIHDLPEGPGRTIGSKNELAHAVKETLLAFVREHVPQCTTIKVRTKSYDLQREGVSRWREGES